MTVFTPFLACERPNDSLRFAPSERMFLTRLLQFLSSLHGVSTKEDACGADGL